ncbi:MAG: hypothetical protein IT436_11465 [Phycisphaerales bacterium]|nr:hypothetical protein [Phycisphaerales bacterium]
MAKHSPKSSKITGDDRRTQRQTGETPARGVLNRPKGGPAGANQGGASRGGSRVEPSHTRRAAKQDRNKS